MHFIPHGHARGNSPTLASATVAVPVMVTSVQLW